MKRSKNTEIVQNKWNHQPQSIKKDKMYSKLIFLVAISVFSVSEAVLELKKNAGNFVNVGFYMGRRGKAVDKIEIKVDFEKMFEDADDVNETSLHLEIKQGDGCWERVNGSPRGKESFSWKVNISPCKTHSVRVGVNRDDCIEYVSPIESVGPATIEQIAQAHYRLKSPESLIVRPLTNESVSVSWAQIECADSYDLWYESHDGEVKKNITVDANGETQTVVIEDLNNCTDYTMYVASRIGEKFSIESETDFSTCSFLPENGSDELIEEPVITSTRMCESLIQECPMNGPSLRMDNLIKPNMSRDYEPDFTRKNTSKTEMKLLPETGAQTGNAMSLTQILSLASLLLQTVSVILIL